MNEIEVWEVLKPRKNGNFFFSPALQISSQPFEHFRQFISEMVSTLNHIEAMLIIFFTLVFVIVYDSHVMLLYMLLLLLDKMPKYMSDTKPL